MSLFTSLVAYLPGNEASGNLIDAHTGGLDLTDVNTVTSAAGNVYATARQYTRANVERHARTVSPTGYETGDIDWMFAAWVYLDSKPADDMTILSKWSGAGERVWLLWNRVSDEFALTVECGGANKTVGASTFGAPSTGTWYMVVAGHDADSDEVFIQVNNGAIDTQTTGGAAPGSDNSTDFVIGSFRTTVPLDAWDGRIGPTMRWNRLLATDEITQIYNVGAGLTYGGLLALSTGIPDTPRLDDWNVELVDLDTGATYILRDEISGITSLKMEPGATRPKLLSGSLTCSAGTSANPSYVAQSLKWGGWQALRFVPYGDTSKEFWGLIAKQQESYSRRPGQIPITLAPIGYLLHSRVIYHVTGGEAIPISGASLTVDDYAKKLVRYSALPGTVTNDLDGNSRDWPWGTLAVQADAGASGESMGAGHVGIDDFKQFLDDVLNALPNIDIELYWELLPTVAGGALTFTFNTSVAVGTDRTSGADRWVINDFAGEEPTGERTEDKIGIYNAQHAGGLGHIELDAASVAAYGRWESVTDAQEDEGVMEDARPGLPKVGHTVTYAVVKDWMVFWDVGDTMLRSNEHLGITETSERLAFVEMSAAASDKLIKLDLTWGDREVQQSKKKRGGRGGTLTPRSIQPYDWGPPVSVGGANAEGSGYYVPRDDHVHQLNIDIPATVSPLLGVFSLESEDNSVVMTTPGAGRIDFAGGGPGTYHNLLNGTEHPDTRNAAATPGDIIFADGGSLWQRRAKGSDDQILTLIAGLPDWADALWTQGPNVGGAAVQGLYPTTVADVVSIGAAAYTAGVDAPRAATFLQVHGAIAVKRYVHNPESSLVIYGRHGGQSKVHVGEAGLPDGWLDVYDIGGTARWRYNAAALTQQTHGSLDVLASAAGFASKVLIDADDGNGQVTWAANVLANYEGTIYRWPTDVPAANDVLTIGTAAATNLLEWRAFSAIVDPGTLSVSSPNAAGPPHTHAITTSADPGANARILASTADGYLELVQLHIGSASSYLVVNSGLKINAINTNVRFAIAGTNYVTMGTGALKPWALTSMNLGSATDRWANTYSVLGNFTGDVTMAVGTELIHGDGNDTDMVLAGSGTGFAPSSTPTLETLTVNGGNLAVSAGNITVSGTVDGVDILNHTHNYDKATATGSWVTTGYVAGDRGNYSIRDSGGTERWLYMADDAAGTNARWERAYMTLTNHDHIHGVSPYDWTYAATASGIPN